MGQGCRMGNAVKESLRVKRLVPREQALPDSGLKEEDLLVLGAGHLHLFA